ncbi:hypothetical protein LOTGIDRAFT_174733 [Lottia gigantea]|uniref:Uncharacterized protein n=1 Tax=Lottia gigantea TaxID=225164 RepID=V4ASI2_LOTGI|nr:hypothetical protein LOTGIDRAFT_174733 [Lottia gigantea]ESO96691.1 hypothetical protein LOTGIDRAFT_174733 [Lottia gigantea]
MYKKRKLNTIIDIIIEIIQVVGVKFPTLRIGSVKQESLDITSNMNWKVLAGVLLVLYVSVTTTKEIRDTASNIQNGLSAAKELGDFIVAKNFNNVIGKLASAVTPYLGIVGPFVSFIMGFFGLSESAELKAIKRLNQDVDNRFDKVDIEFDEVKNLIEWSKIQVQNSNAEQNINAVNTDFEHIYTFSSGAVKTAVSTFVDNFKTVYQDSGTKLYDGIMNEGQMFGDGLFSAVVKHTEYDRGKSQTFMLGLLKLLMKAAKLELAYHQLKGHTAALHDYQNVWNTRFTHIRSKMMSTDNYIVSQYDTQSGKDIDNYLIKNPKTKMNNNDFNNMLYDFLAKKYFWRDWFTVTYKHINGGKVHKVGQCGGYTKFNSNNSGRNVVVDSVDKLKGHINRYRALEVIHSVNSCRRLYHFGKPIYIPKHCDTAYNTFPASVKDHCDPYAAQGVIAYTRHNGYEVYFKSAPNRLTIASQEDCSFVYVFG